MSNISKKLTADETGVQVNTIFNATLNDNKKGVNFLECCDYYYQETLNKTELQQLIVELAKLHNQMETS